MSRFIEGTNKINKDRWHYIYVLMCPISKIVARYADRQFYIGKKQALEEVLEILNKESEEQQ